MGEMKKIFESFDIHKKAKTKKPISGFGEIAESELMLSNEFLKKMIDEGYYAQGPVVFLEKMIEQLEAFNQYFFKKISDKDVLHIVHIDTSILEGYTDWLKKIIWYLDIIQEISKKNSIVRQIVDIQIRITYVFADITLHTGSIDRFLRIGSLVYAISSYLSVIQQINEFHNGTLKELRDILKQAKKYN